MTLLRTPASILALGVLVMAGAPAGADDDSGVTSARLTTAASRCASYGPGFVELGDGACARASGHVHVRVQSDLGARQSAGDPWGRGATSSAELRSEGSEFMPGVGGSRQLRVRSGLQTLEPF